MFGVGCHVVRYHSIDLQFDSCHFEIGGIPGEIKNCEQVRRNDPKSRNCTSIWSVGRSVVIVRLQEEKKKIQSEGLIT